MLIRGNELRFSDLLGKLTNTLEENVFLLHLLLYARWDSKQQRKKYKKGHSFAFSKLFKSIQEK